MKDDSHHHYADWLKSKRTAKPSDAFTDRVMNTVLAESEPAESRSEKFVFFAKVAVLMLAAAIGIGRYGLLLYFLLFNS